MLQVRPLCRLFNFFPPRADLITAPPTNHVGGRWEDLSDSVKVIYEKCPIMCILLT